MVERAEPTRLVGMIDLAQLLHARRLDHEEEHHRQRHLGVRGTRVVRGAGTAPDPQRPGHAPPPGHPSVPPRIPIHQVSGEER